MPSNPIFTHGLLRLASVVLLLVSGAQAFGQPVDIPISAGAATLFSDGSASNGQCVAADVTADSGVLLTLKTPRLKPGVYRAHLNLKMSQTASEQTARLLFDLSAEVGGATTGRREMSIVHFERPGAYQDFDFEFDVPAAPAEALLRASWRWDARLHEKRPVDMADAPKAAGNDLTLGASPPAAGLGSDFMRDVQNIRYHLACDRAWVEPVSEMAVRGLATDKVRYAPGETVVLTGLVVNFSGAVRSPTLGAELICGIAESECSSNAALTIAAGATAPFRIALPLSDALWGREAVLTLSESGGQVAKASAFFTVHTNPWAVMVGSRTMDNTVYRAGPAGKNAPAEAQRRKAALGNQVEFVFWPPDDFGDLCPTGPYWSGQLRRENSAESTKQLNDAFRAVGISPAFYAKICTPGGKPAFELYRKHPDWFRPYHFDVWQLARWDRSREMRSWPRLSTRLENDEAILHHAAQIIESARCFGWDAVRYDSHMQETNMPHYLRLLKETVNRALPAFQWGYNCGSPGQYAPGGFDLLCAGGGLIMEEANKHAFMDHWTFDKYASRHITFRDEVHRRGGHLVFCPGEPETAVDAIYQDILPLAARAHSAWGSDEISPYFNYTAMATRYAGQIWDNSAVVLTNAARWIKWGQAETNLFKWRDYSYLRKTGAGRAELIVHAVNMPPPIVNGYRACRAPVPVENLYCSLRLPAGVRLEQAWRVSADPVLNRSRLQPRSDGPAFAFEVGKLRFWTMLVFCLDGEGDWFGQ